MESDAFFAAAARSPPVNTAVWYAMIGLLASTAAQLGELGVAWPCGAAAAITEAPSSLLRTSASEVLLDT